MKKHPSFKTINPSGRGTKNISPSGNKKKDEEEAKRRPLESIDPKNKGRKTSGSTKHKKSTKSSLPTLSSDDSPEPKKTT